MQTILTREAYNDLFTNMGQLREIFEIRLNQNNFIEAIEIDGAITVAHYTWEPDLSIDFSVHDDLRAECETCPAQFFTFSTFHELSAYMNLQMQKAFATF